MATQSAVEMDPAQKARAHRLLRNFLIVLSVAATAEILMRVFPSFLGDLEERRWIEWLLVSLIGVSTYLVWNVSKFYRVPEADYIGFTPWYQATAAKGPIIALVILMALTNIQLQAKLPAASEEKPTPTVEATEVPQAAPEEQAPAEEAPAEEGGAAPEEEAAATLSFGVDFTQANDTVLLICAFLLGFFSRFGPKLLYKIGETIFGSLWKEAFSEFRRKTGGDNEDGDGGDE